MVMIKFLVFIIRDILMINNKLNLNKINLLII